MPRYGDRHESTRLYVGHLSSRTRSRDLEDVFSRYGRGEVSTLRYLCHDGLTVSGTHLRRVRDVDMKRDFAFVDFSDARDADDARYRLNGREVDGSRIVVEFAKGGPRGPGGARDREYLGRDPAPGSGRCFNCGIDGHWARDCKAGDWKNKCYRCGDRGHIERNCQNSPKKVKPGRSYSQSPSPRRDRSRSRSRSYSKSRSYSRSRSPPKRGRSIERGGRRSTSPKQHRASPPPSKGRKPSRSPSPDERSPQDRGTPSPRDGKQANGSEYRRPKASSRSPVDDAGSESPKDRSPVEENGQSRSPSPVPRDNGSPVDDDEIHASPRGSESS